MQEPTKYLRLLTEISVELNVAMRRAKHVITIGRIGKIPGGVMRNETTRSPATMCDMAAA